MSFHKFFLYAGWFALSCGPMYGQTIISTYAGGAPGNGPAQSVSLGDISDVKADAAGNVYIALQRAHVVYKLDAAGRLTVIAGNGTTGFSGDNGPGAAAQLEIPQALAVDGLGNLYISDTGNSRIRKVVLATGVITTVAGTGPNPSCPGGLCAGDGGPAVNAALSRPESLAVDANNNLYIADTYSVRKIAGGTITTVAGTGFPGYTGDTGLATQATIGRVLGLAVDSTGALYIADASVSVIRKVKDGVITTVAGTGVSGFSGDNGLAASAQLAFPQHLCVDTSDNLHIYDSGNARIRKISGGIIATVAGGGSGGSADGTAALAAGLGRIAGLTIDKDGNVLFGMLDSPRAVRKILGGVLGTIAGSGEYYYNGDGVAADKAMVVPSAMAMDPKGNLYLADGFNQRIRKITPNGAVTTAAGNGICNFSGDGGPAAAASICFPKGVAADRSGRIYIADALRIRMVDTNGIISTIAGNGFTYPSPDGPALGMSIAPSAILVDNAGIVYFAEAYRIRKLVNGQVTTIAGTGSGPSPFCTAGAATSVSITPGDMAFDSNGVLYFLDSSASCIRRLSNGAIDKVTGLDDPFVGMTVDGAGNVYVAQTCNHRVVKMSNGITSAIAGDGFSSGFDRYLSYSGHSCVNDGAFRGDGGPASAASLSRPAALLADSNGNLFIGDSGNGRIRAVSFNGVMTSTTITTSPPSLNVIVDGETYVTPQTFAWFPGSSHRLTAASPQASNVFGSWSDGGSQTHSITASSSSYTATYSNQPGATCVFTLNPAGMILGSAATAGHVTFTANHANCSWTASTSAVWADITSSAFGNGSGAIDFSVQANPGKTRYGTLTIAGLNFAIRQAGTAAAAGVFSRDFRGVGRSDALLYHSATGTAYTALSGDNGLYAYVYNLFTSGFDTLRTADFNGDGKADLVVYNSHSGLAYIGLGNGDGTFAFQSLFWSPGYDFVDAGDLNGDGLSDVALYNSSTGTLYAGIRNADGTFTYKYTLVSKTYTFVGLADFNGDGNADLFLYNAASGVAWLGVGDGVGGFAFNPVSTSPNYNILDIGDLNGDGKADLILYNGSNGNAATGVSNGGGAFAFTPMLFTPGFTSVRLADHTGDGKADVSLYNKNTGLAYFGTGDGSGNFSFQSLFWSPGYDWVIPQDVEGHGQASFILYNSATGTQYTGLSRGIGGLYVVYSYSLWGPDKVLAK